MHELTVVLEWTSKRRYRRWWHEVTWSAVSLAEDYWWRPRKLTQRPTEVAELYIVPPPRIYLLPAEDRCIGANVSLQLCNRQAIDRLSGWVDCTNSDEELSVVGNLMVLNDVRFYQWTMAEAYAAKSRGPRTKPQGTQRRNSRRETNVVQVWRTVFAPTDKTLTAANCELCWKRNTLTSVAAAVSRAG